MQALLRDLSFSRVTTNRTTFCDVTPSRLAVFPICQYKLLGSGG